MLFPAIKIYNKPYAVELETDGDGGILKKNSYGISIFDLHNNRADRKIHINGFVVSDRQFAKKDDIAVSNASGRIVKYPDVSMYPQEFKDGRYKIYSLHIPKKYVIEVYFNRTVEYGGMYNLCQPIFEWSKLNSQTFEDEILKCLSFIGDKYHATIIGG